MTTELRELSLDEIDAVSGANNQPVFAAGLGIALTGIGLATTVAGAPLGLAMGVAGVVTMAASWAVAD